MTPGSPRSPRRRDELWALDPATVHLNHGSYGACPRPVLAEQVRLRAALEANPTRWFDLEYPALLTAARQRVAGFVGAEPDGLVLVPNATSGVTAALRAVARRLRRGDEVLVTDHAYAACRNGLDAIAGEAGLRVVVVALPDRPAGHDDVVRPVLAAVGPRTRAALLDHVTSGSALVLPLAELVAALEPEVTVVVDGAHAPGSVPLALDRLGASFYAGNAHKWLCAPKGAAFLHVAPGWVGDTRPGTVSHGWTETGDGPGQRFRALFAWQGTSDPTAWLSVPTALDVLGGLHPDGWPALMAANRRLVLDAQRLVGDAWGTTPPAPAAMTASMALAPLPARWAGTGAPELTARLRAGGVEAKVVASAGGAVRLSAQAYNRLADYERLVAVLA